MIVGVIAIILGAAGLGIGIFSVINGQDASSYYCNSSTKVQNAIDTIGSGSGTIIITNDITLSATIDIDQGGNYIIQGNGIVSVDCGGDRQAFSISNVETCTIRDLKIDAPDIWITSEVILINDTNDNPIYIQNVQIIGKKVQNRWGTGITVDSDNVWIQDCYFTYLYRGIYLSSNSEFCHILGNSIESMRSTGIYVGYSNYNTLSCNVINNVFADMSYASGIYLDYANYTTLSGNVIDNISADAGEAYGIRLYDANNNTLIGNIINGVSASSVSVSGAYGIVLSSSSDSNTLSSNEVNDVYSNSWSAGGIVLSLSKLNTLSGNLVSKVYSRLYQPTGISIGSDCEYITLSGNIINNVYSDTPEAYGMTIYESKYNTLSGNTIINVYSNASNAIGIYLLDQANNNTILGNMITHINPAGFGYGVYGCLTASYNNVIGNFAIDIKTDGIYFDLGSIGNQEALNLE